jgi:hypothetical protein
MILVYCEHPGPRVAYTFDVLLRRILRIQDRMELTQDPQILAQFDGVRINYSNQFIPDCLHIPHSGFLSRSDLDPVTPGIINGMSGPCLFPVSGSPDFAYDVPAAIFWMISRYEEYNSSHTDEHGRFKSDASLAFKEGFLRIPIVEKWAVELRGKLLGFFPGVEMNPRQFRFATTIDVDNGYRFRGKGWWRTLGGFGKDLWEGRPEDVLFRFNVLMGNLNDPFDRYGWIAKQCAMRQLKPRFFILASPRTAFDHALSPKSHRWKELVEKIQEAGRVGIHPSYYTSTGEASLEKEMEAVAQVTGMPLTHSRQHFLRFQWPDTFRKLVQAGITHDHSMGYADQVGFRAGISISYPFFDLTQDEVLPLTVHPFAVMESVYRFKWRVPPAEALNDMRKIRDAVKSTGGKFVSVWHDKSLSRHGEGRRWAKAYATHLEWAKA